MIVMDLKLDNICAFNNFHINFSYPKKIVGSSIECEYLKDRDKFRYKKVNIIMGPNASGKTTLGKAIMGIFNSISKKDPSQLIELVSDKTRKATIEIEFILESKEMYRVSFDLHPSEINKNEDKNEKNMEIYVSVKKTTINKTDTYEKCVKKLDKISAAFTADVRGELKKVETFGWYFLYPDKREYHMTSSDSMYFLSILEAVFKTLDNSVESVKPITISEEKDERAYAIRFNNHDKTVLIHDGEITHEEVLSSGTKAGLHIADLLTSMKEHRNGFYYCDEKFSFIQTDIEKAILSIMISSLMDGEQLFFTTHNSDILDMNLPKHSYIFLKKDSANPDEPIQYVTASHYLKKQSDSLRNAVENDLFSCSPKLDELYKLNMVKMGDHKNE